MIYKIKFVLFCLFHKVKLTRGSLGYKSNIIKEKGSTLKIGEHFGIGRFCQINVRKGAKLVIGKNVGSNANLFLACREQITIGDNVSFGPNVVIVDNNHDYRLFDYQDNYVTKAISIGNNVWIGANVVILAGSIIEDNVTIGAGTVVSGHISRDQVVYQKREYVTKTVMKK